MPFDALDARILRLLLDRPRTSVREYARILGVARGTLQARLERLERDGVIVMAGPRVSPAALGHPVLAFVRIEVARGHLDDVGDGLATVPEVVEAFSITGSGGDLLTRVVARDNAHLEGIIQRLGRLAGVVRIRTEIALSERVPHRILPLVESMSPDPDPGADLTGDQVGGGVRDWDEGREPDTGAGLGLGAADDPADDRADDPADSSPRDAG